ncbi:spermidine synthase [Auritidibacter sp. NML130574]|uniref:spermidine synthase n=1 Tax=Auritidibacter sp. NML130574 TaxID=2170745 RepID=UPI00143D6D10|nr:fused MFS/spermidine synthase [Auritidibacter sp. NML130574]
MAKRGGRSQKTSPADITPGHYQIDSGVAVITEDPFTAGAWLLMINGAESSQINVDHPTELGFEYMRWAAAVITHRFSTDTRLRFLHLGAGGCTMARWAAAVYPDSRQTAVDDDATLVNLVREHCGLPRAPRLTIRAAEAGEVLATGATGSRDVIFRDVFAQDQDTGHQVTPEHLTGLEATEEAARILGPDGVYLINYAGPTGLADARSEVATLREVFSEVILISDPSMFKSRRRGNMIFAASNAEIPRAELGGLVGLQRAVLADPLPAHLRWKARELDDFCAGAAPRTAPLRTKVSKLELTTGRRCGDQEKGDNHE